MTIVVGHGGSSKASLLLGSTAHYVTHHTDAAVVVVRGHTRLPVRNVVVGVDQGDDDDEPDERSIVALRWALRLPGVERVEVSHADFVPGVAAGPVREPGLESDEAVVEDDELLSEAIARATDGTGVPPNGAAIVPVVAAGTGAFALIEASRDADLVVIGTRGRRRHGRAAPGVDQPRRHRPRPLPGRRRPLRTPVEMSRSSGPGPGAHRLRRMARTCRMHRSQASRPPTPPIHRPMGSTLTSSTPSSTVAGRCSSSRGPAPARRGS